MVEISLEFIGRKLKDIQDEQRLQRMRFDVLELRFSTTDSRLESLEHRLVAIEGKLDRILERLEG
jgi:hypothetical protein